MSISSKKFPKPPEPATADTRQRRQGRVVHDDRGSASIEWRNAPSDQERQVLELDDTAATTRNAKVLGGIEILQIQQGEDSFNPYGRPPAGKKESTSAKRDLRALSEHIKLMRDLEERKKRESEK